MAQILQLTQLVEHDCVAQMNIRGCGVEAQFDTKGFATCFALNQLFDPFRFNQQFFTPAFGYGQSVFNRF